MSNTDKTISEVSEKDVPESFLKFQESVRTALVDVVHRPENEGCVLMGVLLIAAPGGQVMAALELMEGQANGSTVFSMMEEFPNRVDHLRLSILENMTSTLQGKDSPKNSDPVPDPGNGTEN